MDNLKQPALFVGDIDENINFSLPPASGEEYIKRVVLEAQECADVVVADIEPPFTQQPMQPYFNLLAGCVEAPPELCPTLEWQKHQVSEFSNLRLYITRLKDEIEKRKRKWKRPDIHLPHISNQVAWLQICLFDDILEPTLNNVFCLNQQIVDKLLQYMVEHVEKAKKIDYKMGRWIYTLLAIVEQPLYPDTCSCLRSLARACSVIRADSRKLDTQELGALNLFICLVARYFRQLDLADL